MGIRIPSPPSSVGLALGNLGRGLRNVWWEITDPPTHKDKNYPWTKEWYENDAEGFNERGSHSRILDRPDHIDAYCRKWHRPRPYGGPSTIYRNGSQEWLNSRGKKDRVDGPAWIGWIKEAEFKDKDERWAEVWFKDGRIHSPDGPAIIDQYGRIEWYLHGNRVTDPMMEQAGLTLLKEPPWFRDNIQRMAFMSLGMMLRDQGPLSNVPTIDTLLNRGVMVFTNFGSTGRSLHSTFNINSLYPTVINHPPTP